MARRSPWHPLQHGIRHWPGPPPPCRTGQCPPGPPGGRRIKGMALGEGFGRLSQPMSAAEIERRGLFEAAISRCHEESQARDQEAAEGARDPDFLRSLGFWGRDEDD